MTMVGASRLGTVDDTISINDLSLDVGSIRVGRENLVCSCFLLLSASCCCKKSIFNLLYLFQKHSRLDYDLNVLDKTTVTQPFPNGKDFFLLKDNFF